MDDDIYEILIHEDELKQNQVRLTVNIFREVEYISIRKYYKEFDGEWCPSNEGITIPMDISNVKLLFKGLAEIISLAESREVIKEYFGDIIEEIYQ